MKHLPSSLLTLIILPIFVRGLFAGPGDGEGDRQSKLRRVVEKTHEKSMFARIDVSNGLIYIKPTSDREIFSGDFLFSGRPPLVAYEVVGDEGRLSVKMSEKNSKHKGDVALSSEGEHHVDIDELYDNECYLNFSREVPLSMKMDFGVIKGDLDLGGLKIDDCYISTAVSKANIDFKEKNPIQMKTLAIDNGVGKLNVFNLCNANFSTFKLEAGVGTYELHFGGELTNTARVHIDIGIGKLEIYVPRSMGARFEVDKSFLTSFSIDEVYHDGDYYYNKSWNDSDSALDFKIESGMARVSVEWVD